MKQVEGVLVKKKFGQHFLRDESIVDHMIDAVTLTKDTSVLEIGCGDGFLTQRILQYTLARLWVFEIDPDWAAYVAEKIPDDRLTIFQENILQINFDRLKPYKPWVLLSNLPYQITFPILHLVAKYRDFFQEGVVMVQEEVAQKILKTSGRGYGYPALFFQRYFEWQLLDKIPPDSFYPPPKVFSRLLYFKPRIHIPEIPNENRFWKFIKACFKQPRRTLKNNLQSTHYDREKIPDSLLKLRAQQLSMNDFLHLWHLLNVK